MVGSASHGVDQPKSSPFHTHTRYCIAFFHLNKIMTIRSLCSMLGVCVLLAIAPACRSGETATTPDAETTTEAPADAADSTDAPAESPDAAETPAETPAAETPTDGATPSTEVAGVPGTGNYPPEAVESFLAGCEGAATQAGATPEQASAYCQCTLTEIQALYTFDEFNAVDAEIRQGGEPPAEFDEIVNTCVASTIEQPATEQPQ